LQSFGNDCNQDESWLRAWSPPPRGALMYDLAAIAIAAACFLVIFGVLYALERI
jgi:hypothetical protein